MLTTELVTMATLGTSGSLKVDCGLLAVPGVLIIDLSGGAGLGRGGARASGSGGAWLRLA